MLCPGKCVADMLPLSQEVVTNPKILIHMPGSYSTLELAFRVCTSQTELEYLVTCIAAVILQARPTLLMSLCLKSFSQVGDLLSHSAGVQKSCLFWPQCIVVCLLTIYGYCLLKYTFFYLLNLLAVSASCGTFSLVSLQLFSSSCLTKFLTTATNIKDFTFSVCF